MPTLNWIGKDAVVNHHLEVPFRLLKDVPELSCGECLIGRERLQSERIVVRQTPHESKRNVERFPDDLAFQLTLSESSDLRSQSVISKSQPIDSQQKYGN